MLFSRIGSQSQVLFYIRGLRIIRRKKMCSLPKVIVNYHDDEPNLLLSFRYSNVDLREQQFNFIRQKGEVLEATLTRIEANIVKRIRKELGEGKRNRKKKKPNEGEEPPSDETQKLPLLLEFDSKLVDPSTLNIDAWKEGAHFKIGDVDYSVCVNAPAVKKLSLPGSILAGFPVYPKIELEFADISQCRFEWFKVCSKKELTSKGIENFDSLEKTKLGFYYFKVGDSFTYQTTNEDIGNLLVTRCEPRLGDHSGFAVDAVTTNVVEAGPGPCPFETRHAFTKEETSMGRVRCVSYNILADLYVDSEYSRTVLFPYCPPYALKLDYRKQLFLKEIIGYNADLVCLQEVDTKVYNHDITPLLEVSELSGCFNEKGGKVAEGLTCLFRKRKFRLIENECQIVGKLVEENQLFSDIRQKVFENEKLKERLLPRTTALQVVVLESVEFPNNFLVVGNTHLYFHPDADHIRLIQASVCVRYLEHLAQNLKEKLGEGKSMNVILFGDFNSCPEFGVYQFMTTGSVGADSQDWSSNAEEAVPGGLNVRHELQMASACGRPPYTNYTTGFHGCLDYIFYDTRAFEVEEVVPLPSHEEVTEFTALPSITFPSDHLALVCTLRWRHHAQ